MVAMADIGLCPLGFLRGLVVGRVAPAAASAAIG